MILAYSFLRSWLIYVPVDFSVIKSSGVLPLSSITSGQEWVRDFIMDNDSHDHIPDGSRVTTLSIEVHLTV